MNEIRQGKLLGFINLEESQETVIIWKGYDHLHRTKFYARDNMELAIGKAYV